MPERARTLPDEVSTRVELNRVVDTLSARGLIETAHAHSGRPVHKKGLDGSMHLILTPTHPLPIIAFEVAADGTETTRPIIKHPVIHIAVNPRVSGTEILFISDFEVVEASLIDREKVQGFPPVKRVDTEKRKPLGRGSMQRD